MKKIYLIKTATQCCYTSAHSIHQCVCVLADTELEAVAIAFNEQREQTYIFQIECDPQLCLFTVDPAMLIQSTFNVWQDLAAAATGHDTEWGYSISVESVAGALHIFPKLLTVLLANFTQPALELCLNRTALTFHYPPEEINQNVVEPRICSVYLSGRSLSQSLIPDKTQLIYATLATSK